MLQDKISTKFKAVVNRKSGLNLDIIKQRNIAKWRSLFFYIWHLAWFVNILHNSARTEDTKSDYSGYNDNENISRYNLR